MIFQSSMAQPELPFFFTLSAIVGREIDCIQGLGIRFGK